MVRFNRFAVYAPQEKLQHKVILKNSGAHLPTSLLESTGGLFVAEYSKQIEVSL